MSRITVATKIFWQIHNIKGSKFLHLNNIDEGSENVEIFYEIEVGLLSAYSGML